MVSLFDHNYTNVNVATAEGISRALSLGLVPSHLADVIVSAQVDKIPSLFTSNEHARAFVLLRNPVDRAASMFYFLKSMGNERLKNMTVYDYAKSDMIENNWMGESICLDLQFFFHSSLRNVDCSHAIISFYIFQNQFVYCQMP